MTINLKQARSLNLAIFVFKQLCSVGILFCFVCILSLLKYKDMEDLDMFLF